MGRLESIFAGSRQGFAHATCTASASVGLFFDGPLPLAKVRAGVLIFGSPAASAKDVFGRRGHSS